MKNEYTNTPEEKLVVITGASSGFGAALAKKLSQKGHPLLLIARRLDRLEALKLPNCICAQVDITDRQSFEKALRQAEEKYGKTDALVNNAGVMLLGQIADQPAEEFTRMLDVNITALLNGMQLVLSDMKQRNQGTIINISSVAGRKSFADHAAYCGTKSAVHAISETVRAEVAPHNIRVITIAPGAAETELLSHTSSEEIKADYTAWKKQMGSVLTAEDVAGAIAFAYEQPQNVCIREIVIAATRQEP